MNAGLPAAPAAPKRIGVFGGAFDPPHNAHVALAQAAMAQLDLSELRVIPTGIAGHKTRALTPPAHRLAMTRLAFAQLPRVIVDTRELERAGPSFSVDTLEALRRENTTAQLYLIMGADQFVAFRQWHRWEAVFDLAIICVAERANGTVASGLSELFLAQTDDQDRLMSIQMTASPISATRVRQVVLERLTDRSDPLDIAQLVSPAVARYISDHALYQAALPG